MKRNPFSVISAIVLAIALTIVAVFLYERSKVALIIDDEAAWDMRDASPQKKVIISKKDATVETWYACDGKGFVCLKEFGETNAFLQPSSDSEVVGKLYFEQGYVSEEYVNWDAIDTF